MPEGLEIDRSKPLNGTMASYAEQVLICTGKLDWTSRIEDENDGDNLAADLKELLGRGGIYSDVGEDFFLCCNMISNILRQPFHNVAITNSSFAASIPRRKEVQTTSAYLFPSFKYIPFLPRVSFDSVQALVKGYLLPTNLNHAHDNLSPIHRDRLLRNTAYQSLLFGVQDVEDIMILICGHGGRDGRCGVMGPVLEDEFKRVMPREGIELLQGPVPVNERSDGSWSAIDGPAAGGPTARTGLISHIGGHKFAGNVIIYIPKNAKTISAEAHPLAGCGIWYGRVEPKHVEGIVTQTVLNGAVFEDLFRGGISQNGDILRL